MCRGMRCCFKNRPQLCSNNTLWLLYLQTFQGLIILSDSCSLSSTYDEIIKNDAADDSKFENQGLNAFFLLHIAIRLFIIALLGMDLNFRSISHMRLYPLCC